MQLKFEPYELDPYHLEPFADWYQFPHQQPASHIRHRLYAAIHHPSKEDIYIDYQQELYAIEKDYWQTLRDAKEWHDRMILERRAQLQEDLTDGT